MVKNALKELNIYFKLNADFVVVVRNYHSKSPQK